jgi:hypothetical protein
MTSKQRFLAALERKTPDRLPVTTHHVIECFLNRCMGGVGAQAFFDHFGLDPILWLAPMKPDAARGEYWHQSLPGVIESDRWRVSEQELPPVDGYRVRRITIETPKGALTATLQSNDWTTWLTERFVKERGDIDLIAEFMTMPVYDVEAVNREAAAFGERGMVRGTIMPCFEFFGQPGCWQDAACLYGIERLITTAFEDPEWVHAFLSILQERKLHAIGSLEGARFDLMELGGGDASSTVISPALFDTFVAPYDRELIAAAHAAGQRIAYHTCGGMMPILENIVDMGPDAIETLTPAGMGGDMDLAEAKRRVGHKVCLIGGFDQFHFFKDCTPEATWAEVRRCFEEAGAGGGFILSPSDHFFDAGLDLIAAYAEAARGCGY